MSRESWKVFVACALGAGFGSLVALELNQWLWWVGLIVGGLTGYLSYEWRAVLRAIPAAYRAARGWKAQPLFWRTMGWMILFSICAGLDFFLLVCCPFAVLTKEEPKEYLAGVTVVSGILLTSIIVAVAIPLTHKLSYISAEEDMKNRRQLLQVICVITYWIAPPLLLFYHFPRGIWWVLRRIPAALIATVLGIVRGAVAFARFLLRFSWQVFIRIHSEMRLLCMADAALGVAVGYWVGSAIIGALAGGVFGLINYAVVTKRILEPRGLLPAR